MLNSQTLLSEPNFLKRRFMRTAALVAAVLLLLGASKPSGEVKKAIKEAENLSLNQDRVLASGVLLRNLKKATDPKDIKILKDKLIALSRVFYTDSGFEAYQDGKELFEKQKFTDSIEKFLESDETEKGNVEVLHALTLAYLQAQKPYLSENINKRALELCPIKLEIKQDTLDILIGEEKWKDALAAADELIKNFSDTSVQSLKEKGLSQIKLGSTQDGIKTLEAANAKDPKFPETYFLLALQKGDTEEGIKESQKLLKRYIELCSAKSSVIYEREINYCTNLKEAEKRIKP
jgi:hypothetical protein